MAKKAKKPTKKAKRVVKDSTLEGILIECALAVGQGVGSAAVSDAALKYWRKTFRATIKRALSWGEIWKDGRKTVLPLATLMGSLAASYANPITEAAAKKAADTVRKDPRCPAGMGKFC